MKEKIEALSINPIFSGSQKYVSCQKLLSLCHLRALEKGTFMFEQRERDGSAHFIFKCKVGEVKCSEMFFF